MNVTVILMTLNHSCNESESKSKPTLLPALACPLSHHPFPIAHPVPLPLWPLPLSPLLPLGALRTTHDPLRQTSHHGRWTDYCLTALSPRLFQLAFCLVVRYDLFCAHASLHRPTFMRYHGRCRACLSKTAPTDLDPDGFLIISSVREKHKWKG